MPPFDADARRAQAYRGIMPPMRRVSSRSRTGLAVAMLTATLHVASAIVVPLIHAQMEVAQSASEVEASHTDQCPRLHAEGTCLICPSYDLTANSTTSPEACPASGRLPAFAAQGGPPSQDVGTANHPVRAPPLH